MAVEAGRLAYFWNEDFGRAETAGWLHDASVVVPPEEWVELAQRTGITVLPEECAYLMILHQKLSAAMARDVFSIDDPAVLSAIECHTTLKMRATPLDKILFVADKLEWDLAGHPPYLADLATALERSLDAAGMEYLEFLWQCRDSLPLLHPWMAAAYRELAGQ